MRPTSTEKQRSGNKTPSVSPFKRYGSFFVSALIG